MSKMIRSKVLFYIISPHYNEEEKDYLLLHN